MKSDLHEPAIEPAESFLDTYEVTIELDSGYSMNLIVTSDSTNHAEREASKLFQSMLWEGWSVSNCKLIRIGV